MAPRPFIQSLRPLLRAPARVAIVALLAVPARTQTSADRPDGTAAGTDGPTAVASLLHEGRYVQAEAAARAALEEVESSGEEHDSLRLAAALDALAEALLENGRANENEAPEHARRALALRREILGGSDPLVARSLTVLAEILRERGEWARSRQLLEEALAIVERRSAPDSPELAAALTKLADARRIDGDHASARPLVDRALEIWEGRDGESLLGLAETLQSHGELLQLEGEYAAARDASRRALDLLVSVLGDEHPRVAGSLSRLADATRRSGDWHEARALHERALETGEATLRPGHPKIGFFLTDAGFVEMQHRDLTTAMLYVGKAIEILEGSLGTEHIGIAETLGVMAGILRNAGRFSEAQTLYQRSLAIKRKGPGDQRRGIAVDLHNLSLQFQETGDFTRARHSIEESIGIFEALYGPAHPLVGMAWSTLGRLLWMTGDFEHARQAHERALAIKERTLGPEHPHTAISLNQFAFLLESTGEYERARRYQRRALAIAREQQGQEHPFVGWALENLAAVEERLGAPASAVRLYEESVEVREKAFGADHPQVARSLGRLGKLLWRMGAEQQAATVLERALGINRRYAGAEHPETVSSLTSLSLAHWTGGSWPTGLDGALQAEAGSREQFRQVAQGLSEREALRFAATRPAALDAALSILVSDVRRALPAGSVARVWDQVIRSRAVVLDEMAARHRHLQAGEEETVAATAGQLAEARHKLARLLVRGPEPEAPQEYPDELATARRAAEKLERELAAASPAFRQASERGSIGLSDVVERLPERAALLAFVRYDRWLRRDEPTAPRLAESDDDAGGSRALANAVASYAAFVWPPGSDAPTLVSLSGADEVDSLVEAWRRSVAEPPGLFAKLDDEAAGALQAGAALRAAIWDPVAPLLEHADPVFVVPDGALHLAPLAALPGSDGGYLLESGPRLHYLSAERDLGAEQGPPRHDGGLLAAGGADFDSEAWSREGSAPGRTALEPAAGGGPRSRGPSCESFSELRFPPLPGSRREIEEIADLWAHGGDRPMVRLLGREASEAAIKERAPDHPIVHLATHGFFVGGECLSIQESARGLSVYDPPAGERPLPAAGDNPLSLAGLALAGANRRGELDDEEPGEDGILTAQEIAGLDLSGVQWMVLSACDTGLGEVQTGEGVLGLRRAFEIAGAETLIMSLWSVDDDATRHWMRELYRARLDGASTVDAVRQASLEVLASRRRQGLSTHPFYWGGFVAVGGWR